MFLNFGGYIFGLASIDHHRLLFVVVCLLLLLLTLELDIGSWKIGNVITTDDR